MALKSVNGHFCRNCAEEAAAKKGADPHTPMTLQQPPKAATATEIPRGVNQPEPGARIGGLLNIRA